jgi:hypothetical protein
MYNFTREDIDLEAIRALARAAALGFQSSLQTVHPYHCGQFATVK